MSAKGRRTWEHIIASAAPIFNTKGYAGASIADVLAATGLEKGGLYRHFATKDELAIASFDYAIAALEARHATAQAKAASPLARLRAFIDTVAGSIADPPLPGGCPILNTAIDADDTHGALRERAARAMQHWQAQISAAVVGGIAAGEFVRDVDPATIASVLTSTLEGAIMVASVLREPAQMERVARHLHAYLDSFIRVQRRPPTR